MNAALSPKLLRARILEAVAARAQRSTMLVDLLGVSRSVLRAHLADLIAEGELELRGAWYDIPRERQSAPVREARARAYDTGNSPTPEQVVLLKLLRGDHIKASDIPDGLWRSGSVVEEGGVAKLTRDGREMAKRAPGRVR